MEKSSLPVEKSGRDTYSDSLKFYLIFLVVLGHVIEKYTYVSHLNLVVWNFIYLFHMPLFIFISGYYSKLTEKGKYKKGIYRILEVFLTFHILSLLPAIINGTITFQQIITPWWILWYLFSLILWRLLLLILNSYLSKRILLIVAVIISLSIGFIPFNGYILSLSRTFVFFPFFLIGFYANNNHVLKIRSFPKIISVIILFATFIGLFFIHKMMYRTVLGTFSYENFPTIWIGFYFRLGFLLLAALLSLAFMNIVPDIKLFSKAGKDTLLYYVYHGYLVLLIRALILEYKVELSLPILILISVACMCLIYAFSFTKLSKHLLYPVSSWRKKRVANSQSLIKY